MTTSKRTRVDVSLNTVEKTLIDNDVEILGITRAEAIRRRAFNRNANEEGDLDKYRRAVAAASHIAAGQLPPATIEAIAAAVFNAILAKN
jgi:hypothetical protein